jgi:hypothetical protein
MGHGSKIYLASSWRNELQPDVLALLESAGHHVYDFRNPGEGKKGFSWSEIDPHWQSWTPWAFTQALGTDIADRGFGNDWNGMEWADTGVLLLPCGRSAHIEAGYFVGHPTKSLHIYAPELPEPELMYKMANGVHLTVDSLLAALEQEAVDRINAATRERVTA